MPRIAMIILFWQAVACSTNNVPPRKAADHICTRAQHIVSNAQQMRVEAVRELGEATSSVELAYRLKKGEGLTEDDRSMKESGGGEEGAWRRAWRHSDAALAWCHASEILQEEIGLEVEGILQLGVVKCESDQGRTMVKHIEIVLEAGPAPCIPTTFHEFSTDFRKNVLEPLDAWCQAQQKREKDLLLACKRLTESLDR